VHIDSISLASSAPLDSSQARLPPRLLLTIVQNFLNRRRPLVIDLFSGQSAAAKVLIRAETLRVAPTRAGFERLIFR
jgi:hypothetical protein